MNSIVTKLQKIYEYRSKYEHLFPTSVSKNEGELIQKIVSKIKPKSALEIGFGNGIATLWIYAGWKPQKYIVVDPYAKQLELGKELVSSVNLKNIQFVNKESQTYLSQQAIDKPASMDLIFHDGANLFDWYMTDVYFITKILKNNGVLITRNMWNPSVRKAVLFTLRNLPYHLYNYKLANIIIKTLPVFIAELTLKVICRFFQARLCVLQKNGEDVRIWNHFIDF